VVTGIFDATRPPSVKLADECVHCGFCLPSCPTYALWGEEVDSPRGRIHLIKMGLDGEVALDATYLKHFDRCLGCMACVTSCPSGVQYEPLLEATRAQLERHGPRRRGDRLFRRVLLTVFGNRTLLRLAALGGFLYRRLGVAALLGALGVLRILPRRLRALESLLPDVDAGAAVASLPARTDAEGAPRLRVALVQGCVQSVFFRGVNEATLRVLAREGVAVEVPPAAGCCGALSGHAGDDEGARRRARALIAALEPLDRFDHVVINSAGCGSALKHYGRLLADDDAWAARAVAFEAKVVDVVELLDGLEPRAPRGPLPTRVAYHDACHLAHAQGIKAAPRRLLRSVEGLELLEVPEGELCCGSAGLYNLTQIDAAEALGQRKAGHIAGLGADIVVAANPGCLLQIRKHLPEGPELLHPVELLDRVQRDGAARPPAVGEA
jgi:glycolate oxidase iron-sulfur subunit